MPNPDGTPTAEEVVATEENKSLIEGDAPDKETKPIEGQETPEQKTVREAEEKRILEADPATLNDEEKTKRAPLEKAKEEKRLLETPKDQLSKEDQVKREALEKSKKDALKQGAPESYADFKLPENITADAELLGEFKTTAKELNLSQEAAQRLVDLQVKHVQKIADGLLTDFNTTVSGWKKETKEDLGANYKQELTFAGKAIDTFCTPEQGKALRAILGDSGVGNHKEVVKFFIAVGKAISEDKLVKGTSKTGAKTDGELFYPGGVP